MTEQTQTTAQRIQDMLDMNFNFYPGPPGVTAKTIAAEIERLTAEVASKQETIDMLLEDERDAFRHERAQLETQLAKARAEVARREADLSTARITITELDSERNGANAFLDEVAYILQMPPAYMGGVNGWAQVKMQGLAEARAWKPALDAAVEALTDARAQIAALTPDAEAWRYKQACKAWDAGKITPFEFAEAYKLYSPQARRAREARS